MRHVLLIIALVFSIQALAQDCNNPLLAKFNITGFNSSRSGQNLTYCQANQTCCSNETVSAFQPLLEKMTQGIYDLIAARDLYFASLKEKLLDRWGDLSDDINDSLNILSQSEFQKIPGSDQLEDQIDRFYNISNQLRRIRSDFYWNLRRYQRSRRECLNTLLKLEVSYVCLACDPDYADKGVSSNGTVRYSDSLCQNISDACHLFVERSTWFDPLLRARENYQQMLNLSYVLQSYSGFSDSDYYPDFAAYTSISSDNYIPSFARGYHPLSFQDIEKTSSLNTGDSELNRCLFGPRNQTTNSTANSTANSSARNISSWAPDLNGTGFNINLRSDPGYVFWLLDDSDYRHRVEREEGRTARRSDEH